MILIKLAIVFAVIVALLTFKRPLWQALSGGLVMTVLLYGILPLDILKLTFNVIAEWSSFQVLVSLYLITFLQRILESRSQIRMAQDDLNRLFHNRRINIIGACLFIGLLPSAASMILCAELVKDASDGYLDTTEQAFVSSWIRHIPEIALPTYTAVLLMLSLSGVETSKFIIGMTIPMIVMGMMAYFVYLRKIPKDVKTDGERHVFRDVIELVRHLWSLILILMLIICFHMGVVESVLISIVLCIFVYRVKTDEIKEFAVSAFEKKMLGNTFLVLVLKEFLVFTGVLSALPEYLAKLPLSTYLIFGLIFFLATVVSGATAAIAMGTPLAFAAMPDGGVALMIFLMAMTHAASQLSPTHVCLVVDADYFHIPLGSLIRKTIPFALIFCIFAIIYYNMLIIV